MKFSFGKYDLKISYPVLLLVASILSFWQFATFSNVLRCDIQDAMYPWRYFAGECFQNGIFPFWNPYHQFGYPFYADLQYTNWNPEVWLIGNTFGYSYAFIYFLVFFYTWMAGLGMYKLITYLTNNNSLSFFIALNWMLSGCVIAHMQQFVTVIGIAWMPFVVWQFFALIDGLKWRNVFGFSIFSYLFLTGGYQALYFMLFYFFIAYAIYKLIQYRKFNNRLFLKLIFRSCLTIIILLVLLAPVFIAVYRSSNYVSRLDSGVNLSDANFSPLTPQSLISFFLPVISAKMEKFINTDITMSNLFIGLLPMIFLFYSFFKKKNVLQILLLVFSLIYLLAAMGDYTPVREFLYNNVPLMNLFRLSGLFRIIVVFFLLIHISIFLNNENFSFRKLKISLIFFSSFYLIVVLFFAIKLRSISSENGIMNKSIFDWINNASANVLIFWQSILFLTLLLSLLAWCYYKKKIPEFNSLSVFAFLFLFFGIQFNIYLNVAGSQSPKYLLEKSKKFPEVFPAPPFIPLNSSVSLTERINHVLNNEGNFYKKPMKESFSSFQLNGYVRLMDSLQNIKNYLYNQPFIFLSDSIISIQKSKFQTDISSKLFFSETEPNFSGVSKYRLSKEDKITWVNFEPNQFEVSVKNKYDVILNLQQSFFPGWKVYLNNIPINPILNSGFLMSITLNSGVNNIKFEFSDNVFKYSYFISLFLFFIVLSILLISSDFITYKVLSFFVIIATFASTLNFTRSDNKSMSSKKSPLEFFKKNNFVASGLSSNDTNLVRPDNPNQLRKAFLKIRNCSENQFYYSWEDKCYDSKIVEYIRAKFPVVVSEIYNKDSGTIIFSNKGLDPRFLKSFSVDNSNDSIFCKKNINRIKIDDNYKITPEVFIPIKFIPMKDNKINVLIKFKLKSGVNDSPKIYVSVEHSFPSRGIWSQTFGLEAWKLDEKLSNEVIVPINPDWDTDENSVLHIYFSSEKNHISKIEHLEVISL